LADFEGNTRYAEYDNFRVDSAEEKYTLVSLGTYTGSAGQYEDRYVLILRCATILHTLQLTRETTSFYSRPWSLTVAHDPLMHSHI